MYAKVERPERKLTGVNTIGYDMKLLQVKITMVKFTDVQLKRFRITTTQIRDVGISDKYVTEL